MKKQALLYYILILMIALGGSSCQKAATLSVGSWTFNNATYTATACVIDTAHSSLSAYNTVTGDPYSNITIYFRPPLPVANDTFTVSRFGDTMAAHQVSISIQYNTSDTQLIYGSLAGFSKDKVAIKVSNGKIGVSGAGIHMTPTAGVMDTIQTSFNILQTQ